MKVKIRLSDEFSKAWSKADHSADYVDHLNRVLNGYGSVIEAVDGEADTYELLMPQGYEQQAWAGGLEGYMKQLQGAGAIKDIKVEP